MSAVFARVLRGGMAGFAASAGLLLVSAALAQSPRPSSNDLLEQTRRQVEVARQKVESDLRLALREANRLSQTDLYRSVGRLKEALRDLEADTVLTQDRRDTLVRMLKDRIRVSEAEADQAAARAAERDEKQQKTAARRAEQRREAAEQEAIKKRMQAIRELQRGGKTAEAGKAAAELAAKHADSPAARAANQFNTFRDRATASRQVRRDAERSVVGAGRDVDRSAVLPRGEVEFPKDWKDRTKNRTAKVKLTDKEKAILTALDMTISVNFQNSRFQDVIEYLQTYTGQPIVLDEGSLKEQQVAYDTPVDRIKLNRVTVRTVLRQLFSKYGLAYVIKNETIEVTSVTKARDMMVVRVYPLGDLVGGGIPGLGGIPFGGWFNQAQAKQNVDQIIDLIKHSIEPQSWGEPGGGSIIFNAVTMSLIVRQSAEVHAILSTRLLR